MRGIVIVAALALIGYGIYASVGGASGPRVDVNGDVVALATDDLDVRFDKSAALDETFMIFGGAHSAHANAISNVTLAGISIPDARPIRAKYPDFHRCSSPGASAAKSAVTQLDLIPADDDALDTLRSALKEFERSLGSNGDRVCVRLRGHRLELTSAEIRDHDQSVMDAFPRRGFLLVDVADSVDCKQALDDA